MSSIQHEHLYVESEFISSARIRRIEAFLALIRWLRLEVHGAIDVPAAKPADSHNTFDRWGRLRAYAAALNHGTTHAGVLIAIHQPLVLALEESIVGTGAADALLGEVGAELLALQPRILIALLHVRVAD